MSVRMVQKDVGNSLESGFAKKKIIYRLLESSQFNTGKSNFVRLYGVHEHQLKLVLNPCPCGVW